MFLFTEVSKQGSRRGRMSRSYHNTHPIELRIKVLKNFQTQMILSSLLLVEGQDLTGKGAFEVWTCHQNYIDNWAFTCHHVRTMGPLEQEVTISSVPGRTASWATRKTDEDFQSKFQRKREKWHNTTETWILWKGHRKRNKKKKEERSAALPIGNKKGNTTNNPKDSQLSPY